MGVKSISLALILILLISGCNADKTKPVVTDLSGAAVQEEVVGEPVKQQEENKTIPEEDIEEPVTNESEETELPAGSYIITIKDLKLDPQELTIKKGETVIWKHEDTWESDESTKHYIAAHSNEFRSPIFYYGETFSHTFNKTGTFTYIDVLYKGRDFMRGTIIVE